MPRKVLVTGATGYVARQILPTLQERYDCTLVDVRRADPRGWDNPAVQLADLTTPDLEVNRGFFKGVQSVVHLGFVRSGNGLQEYTFEAEYSNVGMAHHVYQLALEEGVERVVVASSNHAADWYEPLIHAGQHDPLSTSWPRPLSDNFYGWAKEAYEHLGFVYACGSRGRKLGHVALRIGAPRPLDLAKYGQDRATYKRDLGAYISPRDLTQLVVKSIETPNIDNEHGIPWQIFYGISGNARAFWSLVNARKVIGYAPEDDSELLYADDIARFLR